MGAFRQLNRRDPNIVLFIIYGLLYDIVINLYKPFAIKFLDRIGGTEFHISLYNSLPGLLAIFALLPGSLLISRFQSKKKITSVFFAFSRTFILMLVLVPFMPKNTEPLMFVVLVAAMNFFDAISQCSLQSFLGETFNGFTRAQAISLRNKFGTVFVLIITLITGMVITFVPKTDSQRIIIYQLFFALSFVFGIFEITVFRKFKEKKPEIHPSPEEIGAIESGEIEDNRPNWKAVFNTLRDKKFRKYLLTTTVFYFAWQAGWPLSSIIQIKTLGADEIWLTVLVVSSGIASFFAANMWAKIIAKKGNSFTLVIASVGMAFNMFFFALSPNLIAMTIANTYGGMVTIGTNIALLNGLLGATPDKNRVLYIGVYNTLINVSLALSPYVSLLLLDMLSIRPALAVVGCMRLTASLVLFLSFYKIGKTNVEA